MAFFLFLQASEAKLRFRPNEMFFFGEFNPTYCYSTPSISDIRHLMAIGSSDPAAFAVAQGLAQRSVSLSKPWERRLQVPPASS